MPPKAELAKLLADEHFLEMADKIPDIIARFDRSFRHLYVNKAAAKATGIPREQFIGKTNRELGVPEELLQVWDSYLTKVFESGQELEMDFDYPTPEGIRHFHAVGRPELDDQSRVKSVIVATRDVTSKKKHLDSLMLAAKYESANHLCAEVGHQINNPLTVLVANLSRLEKACANPEIDRTSVISLLGSTTDAAMRIKGIVRSMIDLTEKSQIADSDVMSVNLKEAVSLALTICEMRMLTAGVRVEVTGASHHAVKSKQTDLVDAIFQVLANAFEAAKETVDPWVKVDVAQLGREIMVRIVDSGRISGREHTEKMFLPFYTTKGPAARGMGLNVAKSSLARLGGRLHFDGDATNTTFVISLPAT